MLHKTEWIVQRRDPLLRYRPRTGTMK